MQIVDSRREVSQPPAKIVNGNYDSGLCSIKERNLKAKDLPQDPIPGLKKSRDLIVPRLEVIC